jgi:hypothetical protein
VAKTPNHVPPNIECQLAVRVPGWLKNEVVDACEAEGVSLAQWVTGVLLGALREGFSFEGRSGVRPSSADVLREYLGGGRVVGACGVSGCVGLDSGVWSNGFCGVCGVFGG